MKLSAEVMEEVRRALEEDGVAVVPGVMTHEECDDHRAQFNTWLSKFGEDGFPENRCSLLHKYNIAHYSATWSVRLKTVPVFEKLYGTQKLASSFDGVAIGPPEHMGAAQRGSDAANLPNKGAKRLHLDQGGKKVGLHGVQGAVYLEEALEEDWVLAVMSSSAKHHEQFFKDHPSLVEREREFTQLTDDQIQWYKDKGCEVKRIAVPKGGMVLWDSRTVHAGAPPMPQRQNPDRWRYVVFVCMVPAVWANKEEQIVKKKAFNELLCSRHWPALGFETFHRASVPPELCAVTELPEIAKTEQVRLLAGDLVYDFNDGRPNGPPKPVVL